jgi:biopolymer transport protein ExbB
MELGPQMKYLSTLIITGFLLPFVPLSAENAQAEDSLPAASYALPEEEASLSSLEEELSLLDEEFEEFKEELFSLENDLQKKQPAVVVEKVQEVATPHAVASNEPLVSESIPLEQPAVLPVLETPNEEFSAQEKTLTLEFAPATVFETALPEEKLSQDSPAVLNIQGTALIGEPSLVNQSIVIDLNQAFAGSPIIYTLLLAMSVIAVSIWLYSLMSLRISARLSGSLLRNVQNKLNSNQFDEALSICSEHNNLFCKMVASGIQSRRHGLPMMVEAMKSEGKRTSIAFWQKLGLLNDIAIIAPMIGLLGTVLGMFYAFYDINRSIESISTLFDGLGISVGTTVAGLIVAILALILHSTAKYRLVRALAQVENEAQSVATLIDDRTSIYKG